MMYQKKKFPFNYICEHRLQVLELPYVKEELSMLILLPEETQDGSDPLLKVGKNVFVLILLIIFGIFYVQ